MLPYFRVRKFFNKGYYKYYNNILNSEANLKSLLVERYNATNPTSKLKLHEQIQSSNLTALHYFFEHIDTKIHNRKLQRDFQLHQQVF